MLGPRRPEPLPGKDRSLGSGLFVDLVPASCWFTNVRSCVSQQDWERLRRMVMNRAGRVCEICGASADREAQRWLEVHERWVFDERSRTQTLRRLICVCTPCHTVTHFGLAQVRGIAGQAMAHLVEVTGASVGAAQRHVQEAFVLWERRSQVVWELDLSMLTGVGIAVQPPPDALRRAEEPEPSSGASDHRGDSKSRGRTLAGHGCRGGAAHSCVQSANWSKPLTWRRRRRRGRRRTPRFPSPRVKPTCGFHPRNTP